MKVGGELYLFEKDKGLFMNKECEASHNRIKNLAAQLVKLYKYWKNDLNQETRKSIKL